MNVIADGLEFSSIFISIIAPMLIAPSISWYIVGLIFKIRKLEDIQRKLATFDMLTGLMTRRAFLESGETLLKIMARDKQPMSLAFLDLDNFRSVNSKYGHAGGDKALKSFSTVLQSHLRNSDLVGRLGGEEFAIVLPNTDLGSSIKVLEKIQYSMENSPVEYLGKTFQCTISIGVSLFHEANEVELEELIRQSDTALYNAKKSGKNRIVEYKESQQGKST